uniref:Uncharacterized protein n=1 Tax=Nelumbo nucifera TaxID=4432 RepID=A0A822ZBA1_NELNU|nr:TPA_asm: hypothetical protein HUJ06_001764 [Nelumbo nucifera]DAD45526.1 TPA_asm: hypothetical protein HUJ06_003756 [Nelumbo nucifera]
MEVIFMEAAMKFQEREDDKEKKHDNGFSC